MDRNQAKQLLPIIQAYAEGKTIQSYDSLIDIGDWKDCENPKFENSDYNYRIKPEPKYRPFENAEECWQEMKNHQPFGWVKAPHGYFTIMGAKTDEVCFGAKDNFMNYRYLYDSYTFADGTPFGMKEGTDD